MRTPPSGELGSSRSPSSLPRGDSAGSASITSERAGLAAAPGSAGSMAVVRLVMRSASGRAGRRQHRQQVRKVRHRALSRSRRSRCVGRGFSWHIRGATSRAGSDGGLYRWFRGNGSGRRVLQVVQRQWERRKAPRVVQRDWGRRRAARMVQRDWERRRAPRLV